MTRAGRAVFVTGGTGYLGRPLIASLIARGFDVHALARRGSEGKLPSGSVPVIGDALDAATFAGAIPPDATFVHLVGTAHPNPRRPPNSSESISRPSKQLLRRRGRAP